VDGQRHDPAVLTPGKDPVPILQEAAWAPGPVWIGAENLAYTGIRSPDLPARIESLYLLRYPDPTNSSDLYKLGRMYNQSVGTGFKFLFQQPLGFAL
jgi:hypothetical protein